MSAVGQKGPASPSYTEPVIYSEKKACKSRLIVGDGNFTYTLSLINKHADKQLASALTATEYKKAFELDKATLERLELIQRRGVHN